MFTKKANLLSKGIAIGLLALMIAACDSSEVVFQAPSDSNSIAETQTPTSDTGTDSGTLTNLPESTDTDQEPDPSNTDDETELVVEEEIVYETVLMSDDVPHVMTYGSEYEFPVQFSNGGDPDLSTTLATGPVGMKYVDGTVSWHVEPIMFSPTETFNAKFVASDGTTEIVSFRVINDEQKAPLAISKFSPPAYSDNMKVLDLDGDGVNELLTADNRNLISTFEIVADQISQKWVYPFSTSDNILFIDQLDYDKSKLIVATENSLQLITSPNHPPSVVYKPEVRITSVEYSDLDRDGISEIILELGGAGIEILDSQSFTVDLKLLVEPDEARGIVAGNFDSDPALEIITGEGKIFDGVTGEPQASQRTYMPHSMIVGDTNNDGLDEIIGSGYWSQLVKYDPHTNELIRLDLENICNIKIMNTDSDPQNELVVTWCQSKGVGIYDVSSGAAELQYKYGYSDAGSAEAFTIGDIDNDNLPEIIWRGDPYDPQATGTPNYSPLVIAAINGTGDSTPSTPIITTSSPSFSRAYVSNRLGGGGQARLAAFVLSEAKRGEQQRIATLSAEGNFSLSEQISSKKLTGFKSIVAGPDSNPTLLIPGSQSSTTVDDLQFRRLQDYTLINEHTEIGGVDYWGKRSLPALRGDTLQDGTEIALIGTNNGKIQVYDIANQQVLWDGPTIDSSIVDIALVDDNTVLVQTEDEISLYRQVGGNLHKAAGNTAGCRYIEVLNVGAELLIACSLPNALYVNNTVIKLFNSALTEIGEYEFPAIITEMSKMYSTGGDKLLIGAYLESSNTYVVEPGDGTIIWSSPALLGEITGIDYQAEDDKGKSYMAISTAKAFYLTR